MVEDLQGSPRDMFLFRPQWSALAALIVVIGLIWRITYNVDFSDESYYAIFIHDWLLVGVQASTLTTLHQTAALIVFPLVSLYTKLVGSMTGLILLLRCFYIFGSAVSAVTMFIFIRGLRGSTCGWLAAAALLAFIPFGLPAPSYNTLGLQGMTVALAAFGCATNREQVSLNGFSWGIVSAIGWAVAVVAYPTLGLPLGVFCIAVLLTGRPTSRLIWPYVLTVVIVVSLALTMVVITLTPAKIYASIVYLNQLNNVTSLDEKLNISLNMIRSVPHFCVIIIAAGIFGIFRSALPIQLTCILSAAAILALQFEPPAFFIRSHDAMTLAAVSGVGLLVGLRPRAALEDRTIALIMLASLVAGLTTAATATNGAFNFCIGCAPAGVLTLAAPRAYSRATQIMREGAQACLVLIVASSSTSFFYGDSPTDHGARVRVERGVFAGLSVQPNQARLIDFASALDDVDPTMKTIAEFGRFPGLILATRSQTLALTAFALQMSISAVGLAATKAFYDDPSHRPRLVLLVSDQYTTPINPMMDSFSSWYTPCRSFHHDLVNVEAFCRS